MHFVVCAYILGGELFPNMKSKNLRYIHVYIYTSTHSPTIYNYTSKTLGLIYRTIGQKDNAQNCVSLKSICWLVTKCMQAELILNTVMKLCSMPSVHYRLHLLLAKLASRNGTEWGGEMYILPTKL